MNDRAMTAGDLADRREAAHTAYLATLTPDEPTRFGSPEWRAYIDSAVEDEMAAMSAPLTERVNP